MRSTLCATTLLLLAACTPADQAVTPADAGLHESGKRQALCEAALAKIVAYDFEGAAAVLAPHWNATEKGAAYLPPPGTFRMTGSYRFVTQRAAGVGIARVDYAVASDAGDQPFACLFAQQGDQWKFNQVVWGDFVLTPKD